MKKMMTIVVQDIAVVVMDAVKILKKTMTTKKIMKMICKNKKLRFS